MWGYPHIIIEAGRDELSVHVKEKTTKPVMCTIIHCYVLARIAEPQSILCIQFAQYIEYVYVYMTAVIMLMLGKESLYSLYSVM